MSLFEQVAKEMATQVDPPVELQFTMQQVWDDATAAGREDEAKAVARIADYLATTLCSLAAEVDWFDAQFPKVKSALQIPGREISFWKNREAYSRWRRKVRRQIEHTIGAVKAKSERKERQDGWVDLLSIMGKLCHQGGLIHGGELGAVTSLADRARKIGIEPADLDKTSLARLLSEAPSPNIRAKVVRSVNVLKRYQFIQSVGKHLPAEIEIDTARRRFEMILPTQVETWIKKLVDIASQGSGDYDEISGKYKNGSADGTVAVYYAAMRNYIWSASSERSGAFDLETTVDLADVFSKPVFHRVIAYWTDACDTPGALAATSAYSYVGSIMTVLSRNEIDVSHLETSRKNSLFLQEGKEASETMSQKTITFCRPIVENRTERRKFLTQHIAYRERAEDLLATDKIIEGERLSRIRRLGTCAAFAAIELAGAPLRESNVLQLRHRGPTSNVFPPSAGSPFFRIALSPIEMKVKKKEVPQIKIRNNALEGAQTLEWYLKSIRPLFPYGNTAWCASNEDEPIDKIRFGCKKFGKSVSESIHLFVAVKSADHLANGTFYNWLVPVSEELGMPLTAHNFRHGLASILLSRSFANLNKVANFLNNTPAVVLKYYAWLNKEALIEEAQDDVMRELSA